MDYGDGVEGTHEWCYGGDYGREDSGQEVGDGGQVGEGDDIFGEENGESG